MLLELRIILAALLLALLVAFGFHYRDLEQRAAQNETRRQVLDNTSATNADGDALHQDKVKVEVEVKQARATYEEAKQHAPELLARDARPVPDSLRVLARERRLSRERLGCLPESCEGAPGTKGDGERKDVLR